MGKRVVIIGGGMGGIVVANTVSKRAPEAEVTLVTASRTFTYYPGLVYVPLGLRKMYELKQPVGKVLQGGRLVIDRVMEIDVEERKLNLESGTDLLYDVLVIATGAGFDRDKIPGLREAAYDVGNVNRILELRDALEAFEEGRILIGEAEFPHKGPYAPIEFTLLLHDHLSRDGRRSHAEIEFLTPADQIGADPPLAALIEPIMEENEILVRRQFEVARVVPDERRIESVEGESLDFDLLIMVPPPSMADFLKVSGLLSESGFLKADPHTLKVRDGIYALGDVADLPVPKLGSAAFYQGEVVAENVVAEVRGQSPTARYDGRALGIMETGRGEAIVVETTYAGTIPLEKPNRLEYLKKRAFHDFGLHIVA